jgi:cytochrome c oxidase cbb3-type subunit I
MRSTLRRSCLGSAVAVFVIANRYQGRGADLPPAETNGKPNYNLGPVKFASLAALFWGIAGFTVGLYIALELACPWLNLDFAPPSAAMC